MLIHDVEGPAKKRKVLPKFNIDCANTSTAAIFDDCDINMYQAPNINNNNKNIFDTQKNIASNKNIITNKTIITNKSITCKQK